MSAATVLADSEVLEHRELPALPVRRPWLFEAVVPLVQAPPTPQPALRSNVVSCFYPGITSTRAQASKYTGGDPVPVLVHDGSRVAYSARCACSPRILHNVLPQPELHDIELAGWSLSPLAWISKLCDVLRNTGLRMWGNPTSHVRFTRVDIGGAVDQAECRAMIARAAAARAGRHLVVMGCSRGAATVLATVLQLDADLAAQISLVIVEAPFDTVHNVVHRTSFFPRATLAVLSLVGTYRGRERHATPESAIVETAATKTALRCPVAFVTSKKDTRVPADLTLRVMSLLKQHHPHVPVHHLELQHSGHSTMSLAHEADVAAYVAFVEDLYARYCV